MIGGLPFRDRTVAVLGLARSGLAAAEALAGSGANVLAWDDSPTARDRAAARGVPIRDLGAEPADRWSALVMSPGIPLTRNPHPVAERALAAGVRVIGDIELLWRAGTGAHLVGITGTNGKSTTTALVGHILKSAGREVAVGGNLGIPVLTLPRLGPGGCYVVEMSSFQLDLVDETRFDVAILLNITPDHLDRHGDMAGYVAAKRRIFRHQDATTTAVVGVDDPESASIAESLRREGVAVVPVSVGRTVPGGVWVADGQLFDGGDVPVMDLRPVPSLPGRHNWQNAAAAFAACRALGLVRDDIAAGMRSFPGLAHRQELVGTIGRVRFVNDSKATNADAAGKALACYDRIHWIAGGRAKAGGIASLVEFFPRIARAYLIGEAAEEFARTLEGQTPFTHCGDLSTAMREAAVAAAADSAPAPVVLLSPACASFDQFPDFEVRGEAFRALAQGLMAEAVR
ncbi:MAG TPA: UDP-N-acetylmuramoyl-L-alanine--D-glutamate ligase [Stellaceae bacterium]|nr:UDP-N-acetylmuramoyl-L-alanine--D-glutamate ligase [Stellaceae bacterium]